ncbi:PKD domain-containing protein [Marinoscillum sp.]|uniref:PKD domain-containing protein n=1 Tax=Marinoscillum sp. TaxID=2024838 RepID=UPI003BAA978B
MKQPALIVLSLLVVIEAYSQCASLRQQRNITFNTDKDCAPVTVTDFTITYFFNTPQDPTQVQIQFEWNDPGSNVDVYGLGDASFSVGGTNTEFTATGTFTYPENDDCVFEPVSSVIFNGGLCETSEQVQVVTSWSRDNDFGGDIAISPAEYDVCFNNAIVDAVFDDNSTFNCNINQEPDNPNRLDRYTQFVYGTNHNAANSIRNLSLVDDGGTTVNLTDGTANLSSTTTRSGVTGVYFGPIEQIPFPADGPNMSSFPISAPADVNNLVGNEFEITLYNWNICNPYNGDENNPNYDEAVSTTAYIRIVDPPVADYQTRLNDASGPVQTTFCLGADIYFENLSTNAGSYTWEFYDDNTGSTLLNTSNQANPVYSYTTAGQKLIRLYASNPTAQGNCTEMYESTITMSPAAMAAIELYDAGFANSIDGHFCVQDAETVQVGFRDATTDIEPDTEWRWELYNADGSLRESIPGGVGTYGAQVTDFTRSYSGAGVYEVRLIARNNVSSCISEAVDSIILYEKPEPFFEAINVCEGERSLLYNIADSLSSIDPRINQDYVSQYEWDLSYDGSSFNSDLSLNNNKDFEFYLDGNYTGSEPSTSVAGTYTIALRMTTQLGGCSEIYSTEVEVFSLPDPQLGSDYVSPLCPEDSVVFDNQSILSSADFLLAITDSISYYDTLDFNQVGLSYGFDNGLDSIKTYYVRLLAATSNGCEAYSPFIEVEVLPSFESDFRDVNYSVTSGNCSFWESTLQVNSATQALNPDSYTWTISDGSGTIAGYPVTKNTGDADFHLLNYSYENSSNTNQLLTIRLDVVKTDACITSSQRDYVINPQPSSDFSLDQVDSCGFATIRLSASQKGLPTYNWNISPIPNDWLNEDDEQTLVYLRNDPSDSDINTSFTLVTQNLAGCVSDTIGATSVVEKLEPPITADFVLMPDTLILPDSVAAFTNNSSTGLNYLWGFDDGDSSSLYDPGQHGYDTPGIYRIFLTVSNNYCEESIARNLVVLPPDPIISFTADTTSGCSPFTVRFINESSYAVSDTYYWEFGDGNSSTLENPVHTYKEEGVYTVRLYGENVLGNGADMIREDYITVFAQPIADFTLKPTTVYVPDQEVFFRNASTEASAYQWDFGDGDTSSAFNPVHRYADLGVYDITLIASNDDGCVDTLTLFSAVEAVEGGREKTPNAFTPSGGSEGSSETINDVFIPNVEGVSQFRMLIYNKWGELLFESKDQTVGWNGYYRGQLQPADVYVYRLELRYSDGREQVKVGDVTLVR